MIVASARPTGAGQPAATVRAVTGLHVESVGAGPPLVLLHGFALHGGVFAPVLPALSRVHRVHVVDLPGHGHSTAAVPDTLDGIVDAVADAVAAAQARERETRSPVVIGWSFGGQVAMRWAARAPGRIAALVLAGTTASFVRRDGWTCAMAPATLEAFVADLATSYRRTLQRFLTLQVQGSEQGRRTLAALRARLFERGVPSPGALRAVLQLLLATDLRSGVADIGVPALVLGGTRDTLAPPAAAQWLAGALPNGRLHVQDGAAHALFLSHPEAFAAAVTGFLDDR